MTDHRDAYVAWPNSRKTHEEREDEDVGRLTTETVKGAWR